MGRIEERVRERARRIWEEEGRPEGRAELHWERASHIVAMEESDRLAAGRVARADGQTAGAQTEPADGTSPDDTPKAGR